MTITIPQLGLYLAGAIAIGALIGWHVRGLRSRQTIARHMDALQIKFDEVARQRDRFNSENTKLRSSVEAMQAVVHKHEVAAAGNRTQLESTVEKLKALARDLIALGSRRDHLENELSNSSNALAAAKYQLNELAAEFEKSGNFYKGELAKGFDKRKSVEVKLDEAKAELDSLSNLLDSSKSESQSVNKMLVSAQQRLENIDEIEKNAIELEAKNAALRHDATMTQKEIEALRRDVSEMDAIKIQNKELSHCLRSMENSRKQYEIDAQRYRDQAENSEQLSDTLRMKLGDVEKNLNEMARQKDAAAQHADKKEQAQKANGHSHAEVEVDDLTKIMGIGKVFQSTLHELGIYSFRQIANFETADIARVNSALKENKGRMEQDDWIGQAKDLYYQKQREMIDL